MSGSEFVFIVVVAARVSVTARIYTSKSDSVDHVLKPLCNLLIPVGQYALHVRENFPSVSVAKPNFLWCLNALVLALALSTS